MAIGAKKPTKSATPPRRGVTCACTRRPPGSSTMPRLSAQVRTIGVATAVTKQAISNAANALTTAALFPADHRSKVVETTPSANTRLVKTCILLLKDHAPFIGKNASEYALRHEHDVSGTEWEVVCISSCDI